MYIVDKLEYAISGMYLNKEHSADGTKDRNEYIYFV